jgi:hypothetical protein
MSKKPAVSRKRKKSDRIAQVVTILATTMAAAYIAIRIINWIRFF